MGEPFFVAKNGSPFPQPQSTRRSAAVSAACFGWFAQFPVAFQDAPATGRPVVSFTLSKKAIGAISMLNLINNAPQIGEGDSNSFLLQSGAHLLMKYECWLQKRARG